MKIIGCDVKMYFVIELEERTDTSIKFYRRDIHGDYRTWEHLKNGKWNLVDGKEGKELEEAFEEWDRNKPDFTLDKLDV